MLLPDPDDKVYQALDALLKKMNLSLVELAVRTKNGNTKVQVVLYSPQGLSIDECGKAHRILIPHLEQLLENEDLYVEVSSPGLERNIKYLRELNLYTAKKAKILRDGQSEWDSGVLRGVADGQLSLETAAGVQTIAVGTISKAKLFDI